MSQMFEGVLATTPRVGQNAVLSSIRTAYPHADEYGKARPDMNPLHYPGGVLIYSTGEPNEVDWDADVDRRIVRIRRRDIVAQAVSWSMASQTGKYLESTFTDNPEIPDEPRYNHLEIVGFLRRIIDIETRWDVAISAHYDAADRGDVGGAWYGRVIEMLYEDDIEEFPNVAAMRILTWFGLPYHGVLDPPACHAFDRDLKDEWTTRFKNGYIPLDLKEGIRGRAFAW